MNSPKNRGSAACAIVATTVCLASTGMTLADLHGDSTQDNKVDIADLLDVVSNFNLTCPAAPKACPTDFDLSDRTDVADLLTVLTNWGSVAEETVDDTPSVPTPPSVVSERMVDPAPVLIDSIYYDSYSRVHSRAQLGEDLDQGWRTRGHNAMKGVEVLPYCYGGGVDHDADSHYSAEDLEQFEAWLDANIPLEYDGPVVLDMEGDWWSMMDHANQATMDEIMDFYIQGLDYAESMRPNAKFGYWGLPKKGMTTASYTGPGVDRLLQRSGAIFPDTYESNVGGNDAVRMQAHIEACLEKTQGRVPVYVQMNPRYRDQQLGGWRHFHTNEEMIRDQAKPSLNARWTDAKGDTHRIAGLGLWDAYVYVKHFTPDWYDLDSQDIAMLWDEVDQIHHSMYQELRTLVADEEDDAEPALTGSVEPIGNPSKGIASKANRNVQSGSGIRPASVTSKTTRGRKPKRIARYRN